MAALKYLERDAQYRINFYVNSSNANPEPKLVFYLWNETLVSLCQYLMRVFKVSVVFDHGRCSAVIDVQRMGASTFIYWRTTSAVAKTLLVLTFMFVY